MHAAKSPGILLGRRPSSSQHSSENRLAAIVPTGNETFCVAECERRQDVFLSTKSIGRCRGRKGPQVLGSGGKRGHAVLHDFDGRTTPEREAGAAHVVLIPSRMRKVVSLDSPQTMPLSLRVV